MKKRITIIALIVSLLISSLPTFVMAENTLIIDMKDMLSNKAGWSILNEGNTTFKDGNLVNEPKDGVTELFGYTNEKHTDVVYDFDVIFNFKSVDNWQGFLLRSTEPLNLPWSKNENYLMVVKEDQIEIQRFASKHAFLAVCPTTFKSGERVNLRYGAINEEKGVHIFLAVNGKTVVDVYDTDDAAIREGGYFGVYNGGELTTILPSSRAGKKDAPSVNTTSISTAGIIGDSVNIDYSYSDFHGTSEGETEFVWYRTLANIDHYGTSMALTDELKEKYLEKIEGASGKTYTITNSDVGFNIKCGIKAKSKETGLLGEEVFTSSVYIDIVENILGNGLFFVNGANFAVINGERKELNKNEIPFTRCGKLYVPAEFSAKALGFSISINSDNIVFSKNGTEKAVSVSNLVKNESGTNFIPINKIYDITGTAATYDFVYEIGMVNDLCAQLNPLKYAEVLRSIRMGIVE